MSLENLSIAELEQEIIRRKAAEVSDVRRQLEEARKVVRELELKVADFEGKAPRRAATAPKGRMTAGEKAERLLTALDGKGFVGASEIAALVGFDGISLRDALASLVVEGKLSREGKARGTKYKLA
jgi:hypothetical protein